MMPAKHVTETHLGMGARQAGVYNGQVSRGSLG